MKNPDKDKRSKSYYWEVLVIIFGLVLFKFGIDEGFNGSIGYNSKRMLGVRNGYLNALYGFFAVIGGCLSIYSKRKK
ncbi:hypothetical protein [Flavobacterium sp. YO12]|uniref:hypothetical protein n=1 Tax=Flavobacterium sp. YO12 TaxID=1920029 RepID=UPI00100B27DB|nr:hypothetical protein [Flavobacterium sp. YO12]RXM47649.1 hypothetical protein BOW55_10035 [Flavobacterium sp. YO12]